jgi:hypothetical protein
MCWRREMWYICGRKHLIFPFHNDLWGWWVVKITWIMILIITSHLVTIYIGNLSENKLISFYVFAVDGWLCIGLFQVTVVISGQGPHCDDPRPLPDHEGAECWPRRVLSLRSLVEWKATYNGACACILPGSIRFINTSLILSGKDVCLAPTHNKPCGKLDSY